MELGGVRDEWEYGAFYVFENKDGRTMVHIMCVCVLLHVLCGVFIALVDHIWCAARSRGSVKRTRTQKGISKIL